MSRWLVVLWIWAAGSSTLFTCEKFCSFESEGALMSLASACGLLMLAVCGPLGSGLVWWVSLVDGAWASLSLCSEASPQGSLLPNAKKVAGDWPLDLRSVGGPASLWLGWVCRLFRCYIFRRSRRHHCFSHLHQWWFRLNWQMLMPCFTNLAVSLYWW